ncbi:MAG: Eco57I restriction-modification methylase domain-containing protein [Actinobacteria bacterium]|nr:Eco57I restriction-modification methylase domain-containing protein [Actinomycetota bacterium]
MDIQQARRRIRNTFESSFDKVKFIDFIKDLFNQYDESKAFHLRGCYIPKAFENIIKSYERIGTYTDSEGKKIDILIVYLKKETTIDRARTAQRNFIANYLKGRGEKDAGLVAFVSPEEDDWRFSFVKMEYKFEKTPKGDVKVKEEFTAARRYSFLVGKNESSHTAQSCFIDILKNDDYNPKIYELEEAFNIEKVTKEFFEKYRDLFLQIKESLDEAVKEDEEIRKEFQEKGINTVDFSKKLLGQIVFLYFLQKKGWFGVKEGQKWGTGPKNFLRELFEKKHCDYKNFFNDVLEPLFYEALRNDRSHEDHYFSYFNCKIPFLNGGLFDPLNDYNWAKIDILLPDTLFSNQIKTKEGDIGTGILDIFDRYNFTVKEDEPLEKEVAVDPEMLGKVFENLLEVKDRKSKGTYYTPREIVHYMCQQSLINYLYTECHNPSPFTGEGKGEGIIASEAKQSLPSKEDIEKLIKYGDTTIEHNHITFDEFSKNPNYKGSYKDYKLPQSILNHAELIDDKLEEIKVCDPAVGSGAFLVGMMNEIIRARNTLTSCFPWREADATKQSRTIYNFKRHAIQDCLYGVDLDSGAVEIAKLRLWLSLIVDEEDINKIKPLPNLDYKIMQGNSLISEFMGIDLDNDKQADETGKLFSTDESKEYYEMLKVKKDELLDQPNTSKKKNLKNEIEDLIIKIFEIKLQEQKSDYFRRIREIEEKWKQHLVKEEREKEIKKERDLLYKKAGFNLEEAENQLRQYTSNQKVRPFFPWKLYFSEVFQEGNGFDIVIANPPYVRQESIRNLKPLLKKAGYEVYNSTSDIYTYFYEKSYQILKPEGFSTFITSNKWMRAKYGENLRKFFKNKTALLNMINFGGYKVFEATVDTNILIFKKETPASNHIFNTVNIQTDFTSDTKLYTYSKMHHLSVMQKEIDSKCFSFADDVTIKIKTKIETKGMSLKHWDAKIYRGIITGFNKAFIIDTVTKERLVREDSKSAEMIKPLLRGRDIGRYYYNWGGLWIIVIPSGWTNQNKGSEKPEVFFKNYFLAIYNHLKGVGNKVENGEIKAKGKGLYKRDDQGNYWWELRDCDYYPEFKKEKIIYSDIGKTLSFVYESCGKFLNNTSYFINNGNKYLLAILNSRAINFYYEQISSQLGNAALRSFTIYIEQLPIPNIPEAGQKPFIELVDRILVITKDSDYLKNPAKQARVHDYERQINEMVYKLYGLTEEEIKIIEESIK